jgi:hypothetical protein
VEEMRHALAESDASNNEVDIHQLLQNATLDSIGSGKFSPTGPLYSF